MKTQNQLIIKHLLAGRSLTQEQALKWWQVKRLASRICELKEKGYEIASYRLPDRQEVKYVLVDIRHL